MDIKGTENMKSKEVVLHGKVLGAWDRNKIGALLSGTHRKSGSQVIEILLDKDYDISQLMCVDKVKILISKKENPKE